MGGIFISYRREDSGPSAGRLRDTLSRHFGAEQVFRDIDTINPGERFPRMSRAGDQLVRCLAGRDRTYVADDQRRRRAGVGWMTPMTTFSTGDRDRSPPVRRRAGDPRPCRPHVNARRRRPADAVGCPRGMHALRITDESWDDQVARLTRALDKVVQRPVARSTPQVAAPEAAVRAAYPSRPPNAGAVPKRKRSRPVTTRANRHVPSTSHGAESTDKRRKDQRDVHGRRRDNRRCRGHCHDRGDNARAKPDAGIDRRSQPGVRSA